NSLPSLEAGAVREPVDLSRRIAELQPQVAVCIRRLCRPVRDPALLEDLIQEVLVKALAARASFRGLNDQKLAGWVQKIAVNRVLHEQRRRSYRTTVTLEGQAHLSDDRSAADVVIGEEERQLVRRALALLSDQERWLLTESWSHRESTAHIAAEFGISADAVR